MKRDIQILKELVESMEDNCAFEIVFNHWVTEANCADGKNTQHILLPASVRAVIGIEVSGNDLVLKCKHAGAADRAARENGTRLCKSDLVNAISRIGSRAVLYVSEQFANGKASIPRPVCSLREAGTPVDTLYFETVK